MFTCLVKASQGDREIDYQYCVFNCLKKSNCNVILWTDEDCCNYKCMWEIVDLKPFLFSKKYFKSLAAVLLYPVHALGTGADRGRVLLSSDLISSDLNDLNLFGDIRRDYNEKNRIYINS